MRWFTSDWHLGHENIIRPDYSNRPFKDAEEMREQFISRFNAKVGKDDITYHLGDFAFKKPLMAPTLIALNGKQILTPGNHDSCFQGHKKYQKSLKQYYEAGFAEIHQELMLELNGEQVRACHLPYKNESDLDQRYRDYRPIDDGKWLLCGHVHEKWKINKKQINVGVDQWNYAPVSEDEIIAIMKEASQ